VAGAAPPPRPSPGWFQRSSRSVTAAVSTVADGVVNLSGDVPTRDLFDLAQESAVSGPGVVEVDSDLVHREPAGVASISGD
jgi:osmotically-inducible protein OsmY